jgi:hypothetical protein
VADKVTKAARRAAKRLKLEVTHVWVMESGWPYDATEIRGVYIDAEIAKSNVDVAWQLAPDGESWFTDTSGENFWLTKHQITTH